MEQLFAHPLFQLFIGSVVIFLSLWLILNRYFFRVMFQLLELREQRTVGDGQRAQLLRKDTQHLMEYIEREVKTAKLFGIKGRDEITSVAKEEAAKIIEQAHLEASRELDLARKQIVILKEKARQELLLEAKRLADEAYLHLVDESLIRMH